MITIRSAVSADRPQLFSLVAKIDIFTPEEKELAQEVFADAVASPKNGYHLLVAVDHAKSLVGFICYGQIPLSIKRWDLYWVGVTPRNTRQGVGTLLLQGMEDRLGPGERIYVDTSSTPGYAKARAFYQRHGYQVACTLPDFYRVGDGKVVYWKEL